LARPSQHHGGELHSELIRELPAFAHELPRHGMHRAALKLDEHPHMLVSLEALRQFLLHSGTAAGGRLGSGFAAHRRISLVAPQPWACCVNSFSSDGRRLKISAMALAATASGARPAGSIWKAFSERGLGANTRFTTVGEPFKPHLPVSAMPAAAALQMTISARAAFSATSMEPRRISFVPSSMVMRHGSLVE